MVTESDNNRGVVGIQMGILEERQVELTAKRYGIQVRSKSDRAHNLRGGELFWMQVGVQFIYHARPR